MQTRKSRTKRPTRRGNSSTKKPTLPKRPKSLYKPSARFDHRIQLFVEAYLANNFNGRQAAISAGYPPKGAAVMASKLLKTTYVQDKIDHYKRKLRRKYDVTEAAIIRELALMGFANMGDFTRILSIMGGQVQLQQIRQEALEDDELAAAINEIQVDTNGKLKIKLYDKGAALERLARYLGVRGFTKDGDSGGGSEGREVIIKGGLPER